MEAQILPGLASDNLCPRGFIKEKGFQRNGIENYDLLYISALKNFNALCVDSIAGEGDVFRVNPFEQISGDIFGLKHFRPHNVDDVPCVQYNITEFLFADVSVGGKKTKRTVLLESGKKSYVELCQSL